MATSSNKSSTTVESPFAIALEIITVATGIMGVVSVGIGAMAASATSQDKKVEGTRCP